MDLGELNAGLNALDAVFVDRDNNGNFVGLREGSERLPVVTSKTNPLTGRVSFNGIPILTELAQPPALFSDDLVVITASAPIKCGGGVLNTVRCSAGSAITLTVKDSPHDSTGRTLFTQTMSSGDAAYPSEIAINGMYASFTGTATFEFEMTEVV